MSISDAKKQARYKYEREKLKRIPLDVQKTEYERIAAAAANVGETVNGYIKKAIRARMDAEKS